MDAEDLPEEVLEHIFSFLDHVTVCHGVALSCRHFAHLTRQDSLWRSLYEREVGHATPRLLGDEGVPMVSPWPEHGSPWCRAYQDDCIWSFQEQNCPSCKHDHIVKLLMVGDAGIGKTAFLNRYIEETFNESWFVTIGIDFRIKTVALRNKEATQKLKLQIWDTAGAERFRTITQAYYRGASGIFLMFDFSDRRSFDDIRRWADDILRRSTPGTPVVLVGLKADLAYDKEAARAHLRLFPPVTLAEAYELAASLREEFGHVRFVECSSKTGHGVEKAVVALTRAVVKSPTWQEWIANGKAASNLRMRARPEPAGLWRTAGTGSRIKTQISCACGAVYQRLRGMLS